jgi:ATP phosphoribosyltransferase regulatory subunit
VVGTRYAEAAVPLRFCYFAHAWRAVERGAGEPREFLQGGLELIGADGPEGDAEVVALTIEALDAVGLRRHRIGIGDGSLYRKLLSDAEVPEERHVPLLECLSRRDLVGLEDLVADLPERDVLVRLPALRGGPEVLDHAEGLRPLHELLAERGVAERVIFDLGLVRQLGYYTGAVFEVYDPAVGFALGGGGRYDELLGRYGRALPACGVALDLQRVHQAQAAEEALA